MSGLYYYGARYYDPGIGRWLISDPADQYFSPYVYCGNNPVNTVDRDGSWGFLIPLIPVVVGYVTALTTSPDLQHDMLEAADTFTDPASSTTDKILIVAGAAIPVLGAVHLKGGKEVVEQGVKRIFKSGDEVVDAAKRIDKKGTEIVERVMSKAELKATKETGLMRGGREGVHYVTDAANRSAKRARQRLSLPKSPEVRVKMEVPIGKFSKTTKVKPDFKMPGGGMERKAKGQIPIKILEEQKY